MIDLPVSKIPLPSPSLSRFRARRRRRWCGTTARRHLPALRQHPRPPFPPSHRLLALTPAMLRGDGGQARPVRRGNGAGIEQHVWLRRSRRRLGQDGGAPWRPHLWVSAWGSSSHRCPTCDLRVFSLPSCLWPVPIHVCRPAQVRESFRLGTGTCTGRLFMCYTLSFLLLLLTMVVTMLQICIVKPLHLVNRFPGTPDIGTLYD